MPFHTVKVARPPRWSSDGREGRLVAQASTTRDRPTVIPDPHAPPAERFTDAYHVRTVTRAASLTPRRSAVPPAFQPATEPHLTGFRPPPSDLTAGNTERRAADDLAAALFNLRHMPNPYGPFLDGACPWPALHQHRNLLIQVARIARRTLEGYRPGQPDADLSPAHQARAARLATADAESRTHSGRSPQHGRR